MSKRSAVVVFLALWASPSSAQPPTKVSLCHLFADPARWDGVLIETRGKLLLSGGAWLDGRKNCSSHVNVGGLMFENLIALTPPGEKGLVVHSVSYSFDRKGWDRIVTQQRALKPGEGIVEFTVVGLFETRSPLGRLVIKRSSSPERLGFGDDNIAPAQILPREFKDIAVIQ